MSHLARRGDPEVRLVIGGQRQGQVYLCDAADPGSRADCRHPVSEGYPGRFQMQSGFKPLPCPCC